MKELHLCVARIATDQVVVNELKQLWPLVAFDVVFGNHCAQVADGFAVELPEHNYQSTIITRIYLPQIHVTRSLLLTLVH